MRTRPAVICLVSLLAIVPVAISCAPTARVTSSGGPSISEAQAVPYNGPKARVAVGKFVDKTAKGGREIGDGMAEMLTTALFNTNRFIVLERGQLSEVMEEQDLGASGRVKRETAAPIGEIEGAELLVTGAVTEFEPEAVSGGGGAVTLFPIGVGGVGFKKAHMAIDVRIVDAKTSRIVAATSVQGSATDVGGGIMAFPASFGIWANTPMEKAIRACIQKAVDFIVQQTPVNYYRHQ